jgi:hypothetical protein
MIYIVFASLWFFLLVFVTDCNHLLGGTITWHPLNISATGTPVAIVITQTYTWSYSYIVCTSPMLSSNQMVPNYAGLSSQTLVCITNCGSGSVGYSNVSVIPYCTDSSSIFGITVGQRSDIVYLKSGDDFLVAYQDGPWSNLATSLNASWSIASRINVKLRPDNNLYNNAPLATMMSPIDIPVNIPTVINVPISDADSDILRCRWANSSNECGDVCPPGSLPPSTVLYPNCTIIITGQNISDWFAVAIMVNIVIYF